LILSAFNPAWEVKFYDANGDPLMDTNGNGSTDTGLVPQGDDKVVSLHVNAPATADIGENIHVILSAVSSRMPSQQAQAILKVAIPTAFAQALQKGTVMRAHLVWRENQISALASPEQFFGSNLAIQRLVNGNYFFSWERNAPPGSDISYADLKFTLLSKLGGNLIDERSLTDNSGALERTEDRYLVTSVTSPGDLIGVLWVRTIYREFGSGEDTETKSNQNVLFTILDADGNIIAPTQNLTNNNDWRGKDDLGVPYYTHPRISATEDNRFVIAWTKDVEISSGTVSDIEYVVYEDNGAPVKTATLLTSSQPDGIYYITPMLEKMTGNQALISYSKIDPIAKTSQLVYQVLSSDGLVQKTETQIGDSSGATTHDGAFLGTSILLAWPSSLTGEVGYTLLNAETADVVASTQYISSPNLRDASSVSVARDANNHGVITWADRNQNQYLYYSLVSQTGTILTPEMIFFAADEFGTVNTNTYGYGLASYEGTWRILLPMTPIP
jgi:hypothetical protein